MSDDDVEKVWTEFWVPTLRAALAERGVQVDGNDDKWTVDTPELWSQIKRELFDFHSAMQVVPSVYDHATGGQLSKITYDSVGRITGAIDEHYAEIAQDEFLDALLNVTEQWGADSTVEAFAQELLDSMEISLDEFTDYAKHREQIAAMRDKAMGGDICQPLSPPVGKPVENIEPL